MLAAWRRAVARLVSPKYLTVAPQLTFHQASRASPKITQHIYRNTFRGGISTTYMRAQGKAIIHPNSIGSDECQAVLGRVHWRGSAARSTMRRAARCRLDHFDCDGGPAR